MCNCSITTLKFLLAHYRAEWNVFSAYRILYGNNKRQKRKGCLKCIKCKRLSPPPVLYLFSSNEKSKNEWYDQKCEWAVGINVIKEHEDLKGEREEKQCSKQQCLSWN